MSDCSECSSKRGRQSGTRLISLEKFLSARSKGTMSHEETQEEERVQMDYLSFKK